MVEVGLTLWLPLVPLLPDQPFPAVQVTGLVALLLMLHDSVVLLPLVMEVLEAWNVRLGATAGGGGGVVVPPPVLPPELDPDPDPEDDPPDDPDELEPEDELPLPEPLDDDPDPLLVVPLPVVVPLEPEPLLSEPEFEFVVPVVPLLSELAPVDPPFCNCVIVWSMVF